MRVTTRLVASMTEIDALDLLVTQTSPFARTARACGALPTVIVTSFELLAELKALTELWSWFTTHTRSAPVAREPQVEPARSLLQRQRDPDVDPGRKGRDRHRGRAEI